jgi:hypothetical protein
MKRDGTNLVVAATFALAALLIAIAFVSTANAQVLICSSVWGQAPSGCATGRCATPSATDLVSTDAAGADRGWKAFGTLQPTDKVDACAAKDPADYRDITGRVAVSTLGSTPVPPVVPPPTPTPGSLTITWTAPTTNTDGTPANVTGYRVTWTGAASGEAVLGNVLTYTLVGVPGTYFVRLYARDASGESQPTNPVSGVITASVPPPVPTVITTEVLGTWTLKRGTSNVLTGLATYEACKAAAEARATTTAVKYTCNLSNSVTVRRQ